MLLTFLFVHFSHHLILQFWDFSFSICVPGHIHSQNPCSHTNAHMHMRAISHTHLYPHTSLCLSLPFSCSSPTSNNSSAYKTKWRLWIIAQCPLWMALQVLTMHIHIFYKKCKTIAPIKPTNPSFCKNGCKKHLKFSYSHNYYFVLYFSSEERFESIWQIEKETELPILVNVFIKTRFLLNISFLLQITNKILTQQKEKGDKEEGRVIAVFIYCSTYYLSQGEFPRLLKRHLSKIPRSHISIVCGLKFAMRAHFIHTLK